jgi:hypothetical protein
MMIKHFKLADGTSFIAGFVKILMNAVFHKEMLEITRQHDYIIVHLDWLLTQFTLNGTYCFLIKVVQTK